MPTAGCPSLILPLQPQTMTASKTNEANGQEPTAGVVTPPRQNGTLLSGKNVYRYKDDPKSPSKRLRLDDLLSGNSLVVRDGCSVKCRLVQQGFVLFTIRSSPSHVANVLPLEKNILERGHFARCHGLFYAATARVSTSSDDILYDVAPVDPEDGAVPVIVFVQMVGESTPKSRKSTSDAIAKFLNESSEGTNNESIYTVPPDFDDTPDLEFLGKLGSFIVAVDAVKIVQMCFANVDNMWAQNNRILADSLFSHPYPKEAKTTLGYTSIPLWKCPTKKTTSSSRT